MTTHIVVPRRTPRQLPQPPALGGGITANAIAIGWQFAPRRPIGITVPTKKKV
jgi:hypothetical protein